MMVGPLIALCPRLQGKRKEFRKDFYITGVTEANGIVPQGQGVFGCRLELKHRKRNLTLLSMFTTAIAFPLLPLFFLTASY